MTGEPEHGWLGQYVLDARGNPMPEQDTLAWVLWYGEHDRTLALTEFAWGVVSTIFLGLDHNFLPMGNPLNYKPILWETMVFGGHLDQEQVRYDCREKAIKGHRAVVARCKKAYKEPKNQLFVERIVPDSGTKSGASAPEKGR